MSSSITDPGETDGQPAPHVAQTRSALVELHASHHKSLSGVERSVDRLTAMLSRPVFLGAVVCAVVLWTGSNVLVREAGYTPIDPSPFFWLDGGLALMGLVMGILILSTQRRADRLADLREQLTLELVSLTERKVGKIIELIEELRRDSPEVANRIDEEAREMSEHTDQHEMLHSMKEALKDGDAAPANGPVA